MSIRLRLSLLLSTILALTMILFGIVLYTTQSQYTLNWLKNDVLISSDTLGQSISRMYMDKKPPDSNPNAPSSSPPPPPVSFQAFTNDQSLTQLSESEIVRVLDPDGHLLASPVGSIEDTLPISAEGLKTVRGQKDYWQIETVAGKRLLIYNRPILQNNRVMSILQVARPLTERDQSLRSLNRTLVVATLLTTLIAFIMGWILSGITLKPIDRITQTAQDIGTERDFSRRVTYKGPMDEVGRLTVTLNSMLAQLQDAYQRLASSLEMQRSFVADVSHELRTPLTTLRGNLGLLNRTPPIPADEQSDILRDMVDESDRLIRLVNNLLILARADAGRNLGKGSLEIYPVMEEAVRQARQLAPGRKIQFDSSPDLTIIGERDAFKQVLLIVLDNAIKHSEGNISVTAEQKGAQVEIRIQDSGPGIPPEKLSHVFDRFYRGESASVIPGFGLGLPIARSLVEGQDGSIQIESKVGQGSLVKMIFKR
jgi:signal transduction histidine kinase